MSRRATNALRVASDLRAAVPPRHAVPGATVGLGWLIWVAGCRVTLPVLKRVLPLPVLVRAIRLSAPSCAGGVRAEVRRRTLGRWWTSGSPLLAANCLERAIVIHGTTAPAHPSCALVVGFRRSGARVQGHAWVTLDGEPLLEAPQAGESFVAACAFDADGRRIAAAPA